MARLEPGVALTTRKPRLLVDPGLPPGDYEFQLVVENDRRVRSEPVSAIVRVVETTRPRPIAPRPAPIRVGDRPRGRTGGT